MYTVWATSEFKPFKQTLSECHFQKAPFNIIFHSRKLLLHYMFQTRGSISMPCWRCGGFLFLRPGSVLAGFLASLWGLLLGVYLAHKKTRRATKTAKAIVPRRIAHQYFLTVSLRPVVKNKNTTKMTRHCSPLGIESVLPLALHVWPKTQIAMRYNVSL